MTAGQEAKEREGSAGKKGLVLFSRVANLSQPGPSHTSKARSAQGKE